jgi:hypothetical protein
MLETITIRKTKRAEAVITACMMAYGCLKEEKKTRIYLHAFNNDGEIIEYILKDEHVAVLTRKPFAL